MMTSKTFGVVGGGAVGTAVAKFYGGVTIYDKYNDSDSIEEVCKSDYIFVSVPTPFDDGFDSSEMDDAMENVANHLSNPESQVVIIKSTVIPGTTSGYQEKYPDINLVFSPEFLTESTAVEDFAKPDKQLVGFTKKTKDVAEEVLNILPDAPYKKTLPASECEMVKYTVNSYYAFKVIFANQIYDFCTELGIDYDLVREGLEADQRIVTGNFDVMHGGSRGYKGKCLPKDVKTLIWFAQKNNVDVPFLETIDQINERLIKD